MVKSIPQTLFGLWLAVLALALGLTLAVDQDWLPNEAGLIREVQGWSFPGQTHADAVRAVTGTAFVVAAGLAVAVLHWLTGDRRAAVVVVVALLLLVGLQLGVKEAVGRPRPAEVAAGIEVRASQTSPSFPAGHVMGPMLVYGWAIYLMLRRIPAASGGAGAGVSPAPTVDAPAYLRRGVVGGLIVVLALTGVVSVWLGVHWPTDVLGGYLWGAAILLPAFAANERLRRP